MSEKKTYRIEVFQFENGNSGARRECGFIFRHGELQTVTVPVASGSETPRMEPREALVAKASGAERVFYPHVSAIDEERTFQLNLVRTDRMPSGLLNDCPHCDGKGYLTTAGEKQKTLATPTGVHW